MTHARSSSPSALGATPDDPASSAVDAKYDAPSAHWAHSNTWARRLAAREAAGRRRARDLGWLTGKWAASSL
eukprot:1279034-Pyramimonas_sp.AAC.1